MIAAIVSLALLTVQVAYLGLGDVARAIASIGWRGFLVFTGYWVLVLAVLGLAWRVAAPPEARAPAAPFVWGRLVREAAADLMPFAQIGGLVFGARSVMSAGVAEEVVVVATLVDLAAEMAAQAIYTLAGLGLAFMQLQGEVGGSILLAAVAGVGVLLVAALALTAGQGRAVRWLGRAAQRWMPDSLARADAVEAGLERMYRRPATLSLAVGLHLVGWFGSALGSWIALRFMGVELPLSAIIVIEALVYAIRNVGFALPGGLGVQEGAYVLLGPLLGLHADQALALSLLKRGRDLALGAPTLLAWQAHAAWRARR